MNRINNETKYCYLKYILFRHQKTKLEAFQLAACFCMVNSVTDGKHGTCRKLFITVNNSILSNAH